MTSALAIGASDHQPRVGQIEPLRDGARKIEGLRDYHLPTRTRKVEGDVVAEHKPIILHWPR